jgi:hypothetical protein
MTLSHIAQRQDPTLVGILLEDIKFESPLVLLDMSSIPKGPV